MKWLLYAGIGAGVMILAYVLFFRKQKFTKLPYYRSKKD